MHNSVFVFIFDDTTNKRWRWTIHGTFDSLGTFKVTFELAEGLEQVYASMRGSVCTYASVYVHAYMHDNKAFLCHVDMHAPFHAYN